MSNNLLVCLYNTEPESSEVLRAHLSGLNFVRLVEEVDDPVKLAAILQDGKANVIFFHLDPDADSVVNVIGDVSNRYPDLSLIALSHQTNPQAILAPMRAGCEQYVCEPIDDADLAQAVGRIASRRLIGGRSRCICVTGANGGCGVTSVASNLSLELGRLSESKCCLIDLDLFFGDCALNFDAQPKYTVYDLAQMGEGLDRSVLESTLTELPCGVSLLARPQSMEEPDQITPEHVHRIIEFMGAEFENVVVDLPSHPDQRSYAALVQADLILLVCQLSVPSIRNIKRYMDALVGVGISGKRIEIVVNRSGTRTGRIGISDVEHMTDKTVFASIPNDYQFVLRSIDLGEPIASLDQNNPVRKAIRAMATRILHGAEDGSQSAAAGRGFFSRLLSK